MAAARHKGRPAEGPIAAAGKKAKPATERMVTAARDTRRRSARKAPDAIERACRERGLRMTGQRTIIARVLDRAEDHPDVVELHRRAAAVDEKISLSTVYRTVKLFQAKGILERLDFRDSRARYEQAAREHHDHLINLETGDVIEFRSEDIEALQTEIARRLGYRVVYHRLELYAVPLDEDEE